MLIFAGIKMGSGQTTSKFDGSTKSNMKQIKYSSHNAPFVLHQSENGRLTLKGRLHRVMMLVDDGASLNGFFMDSDQGPTMLRTDIVNEPQTDWTLSGTLEIGIQSNRSFRVSQDNRNPGTDITVRMAEIVLENDKYGRASFGRGFASAWVIDEADLSGTVPAALLSFGSLAPAMKFVDRSNDELSSFQVNDYFLDTERLLLVDRLRYDSPSFGGGIQISSSLASDTRWDAAIRFYPSLNDWSIRAAATYEQEPFGDVEHRGGLLISSRHNNTGLSLTAGIVLAKKINGEIATGYVIKGGWIISIDSLGHTALSVDYGNSNDVRLTGDRADSFGIFALRKWNSFGLDLYMGYRNYYVRRPDIDLYPLQVMVFGVIYTF